MFFQVVHYELTNDIQYSGSVAGVRISLRICGYGLFEKNKRVVLTLRQQPWLGAIGGHGWHSLLA